MVAALKEHANKQVAADKDSPWQKLLALSDEQIAAVSGQTAGVDGAKTRAAKWVRGDTEFLTKLPDDFAKPAEKPVEKATA
jgi:hypothetical protein